eukprot:2497204-Alexandrium_andersonii.AAC.1
MYTLGAGRNKRHATDVIHKTTGALNNSLAKLERRGRNAISKRLRPPAGPASRNVVLRSEPVASRRPR